MRRPRRSISALDKLCSIATRYGALSSARGIVSFVWRFEEHIAQKGLRMDWREQGGPPVVLPTRKGFGHLVLERLVPEGLAGEAAV